MSLFLDIAKFADFQWKNANVSRTKGVCHVIYIFLALLWVRYMCATFYHCRICVTDFRERERGLFAPHPWAAPERPIMNSANIFGTPLIEHTVKTNCLTFPTVDPKTCSISIFYKRVGTSFSTIFCTFFFKKNIYIRFY